MMKGNISFMTETDPHKPLVGGSNPPAATFCIFSFVSFHSIDCECSANYVIVWNGVVPEGI